jgi:hypothetical protein
MLLYIFGDSKCEIPQNNSLTADAMKNQMNVGFAWEATNWSGACDELAKIAHVGHNWNR